jgi:hypothetical protein
MNSLITSTVILLIFTALCAGSYYHGDAVGMFNILTAWRFFVRRLPLRLLCRLWCPQISNLLLLGGHRHRRRVSGWQRQRRRIDKRTQVRHKEHVVHHVHEHDD